MTQQAPKFAPGDKVKIVGSPTSFTWYSNMVGEVFTIKEYDDGYSKPRYRIQEKHSHFLLEGDIEAVEVKVVDLTLAQVKSKLVELDTAIDAAKAELASLEAKRTAFLAELEAAGLSLVVAASKRTLKDLYDNERHSICNGDQFIYVGRTTNDFTSGHIYRVLRVDEDGSVKMSSEQGYDWVWTNAGIGMVSFRQA